MANDMQTAVHRWLTQIMPNVAYTLTQSLSIEDFLEMAKEKAIHGPFRINIEELRGPITHINFHFMVVPPIMMMATTATFRDNDITPPISFDTVFDINTFHTEINDPTHLQQLVDTLINQYQQFIA